MSNIFWSFLSPVKTSNPQDQSTNMMNHNSFVNESLSIQGKLYIKNEKTQIQKFSEICTVYMTIINEKFFSREEKELISY